MNLYKYFYKHFSSTTSERPVLAGVQSEVFKVMLSLDSKCKWIIIGRVKTGYLDSRGLGQTTQQYNLQSC